MVLDWKEHEELSRLFVANSYLSQTNLEVGHNIGSQNEANFNSTRASPPSSGEP